MMSEHGISEPQASKAVGIARTRLHNRPVVKEDQTILKKLTELVEKHPIIGFWPSYHRLK